VGNSEQMEGELHINSEQMKGELHITFCI